VSKLIIANNQDGIFSLTINRPEKKNALTHEMYSSLDEGFKMAAQDSRVRVVLVQGAGDNFTSGNDLKEFAGWGSSNMPIEALPAARFIKSVVGFNKPVVAAVRGAAVGIGTTLLLHCDVVVAGNSAVFNLPFVKLGLVPEFGSSMLLPLLAGRVRASQALLLGEPFDAGVAYNMGIVSVLCDDDRVETEALEKCRQLAALPPETVQQIKGLINTAAYRRQLLSVIDEELTLFAAGLTSAEHREAILAFFEKRAPNFSDSC